MQCQECDRPATLHITEAQRGILVNERHFCEPHAQQYLQELPPENNAVEGGVDKTSREILLEPTRLIISEIHDQQVMVLREIGGRRTLPIVIGIFEATSLDRRLRGLPSPRPLTHDAWADTSRALGVQVQDVLIYDLKDYTYYVWVRIQHNGGIVQVDVRPSDAVILAVILKVPILVARQLLEAANSASGT